VRSTVGGFEEEEEEVAVEAKALST